MKVNCPTCNKPVEWHSKNTYRPFCSQQCKLIDLGEWASEGHRINGSHDIDDIDREITAEYTENHLH